MSMETKNQDLVIFDNTIVCKVSQLYLCQPSNSECGDKYGSRQLPRAPRRDKKSWWDPWGTEHPL